MRIAGGTARLRREKHFMALHGELLALTIISHVYRQSHSIKMVSMALTRPSIPLKEIYSLWFVPKGRHIS